MMNSTRKNISVTDFYAGKSILITGGTGFIGKVLIEKLLYTCLDIDKIYLLIRGKEHTSSEQRIQEIIETPIFDRIRQGSPDVLKKLIPITGDILMNDLGLKTRDEQLLIDQVSVVFNSAASVRFDETLDISASNNYESAKRVLSLCHRMKSLKSLVHVSTAFTNPQNKQLDEIVYPPAVEPEELQAFIEGQDMEDKDKLTKFLRGRPNTYTLTKGLAENYVARNHGNIPTTIVRPSAVTSAASGPIPGWIDSWSAATDFVVATSLGYSRVVIGNKDNLLDLIPVDYVSNLAIVAAARNKQKNLEIFNSCTTSCNPISIKDVCRTTTHFMVTNGYNELPIPFVIFTQDGMKKDITVFLLEHLPASISDAWLKLQGKKQRYVKLQAKVTAMRELVKFFTSRSYNFSANKTIALSRSLSEKDAKLFPFNPMEINWKQYLPVYCSGIRRFLMKR